MAGLVPAIHVLLRRKSWMPATSAGMTRQTLGILEPPNSRRALLQRRLDVVVAHDLAPARDLAVQQRARGGRRALILRVRRDAGVGPRFQQRRIGHDLL